MFDFLKKKKEEGDAPKTGEVSEEEAAAAEEAAKSQQAGPASSDASVAKLSIEIDKMKASVESFGEVRKSLTERMTGMSEQIGELRAMILDRDKTIQGIELKAIKASDLVESVQPDKLMTELQKEAAKFEALKANLEGNEAIMNQIMTEMKEMRKKVEFLRGIEEIIKLSEQVKENLIEIKKVEASIHIESEKIEAMYTEIRKKYSDIDTVGDSLQEVKVSLDQHTKDVDLIKTKITELATKDELDKLVQKVQRYIDALKELNKASSLTQDLSRLKTLLDEMK